MDWKDIIEWWGVDPIDWWVAAGVVMLLIAVAMIIGLMASSDDPT